MKFDQYLWNLISRDKRFVQHRRSQQPSRMRQNVKEIREQLEVFVSEHVYEIPSIRMADMCSGVLYSSPNIPYTYSPINRVFEVNSAGLQPSLDRSMSVLEDGYNLLRGKATELMVWVLSDRNRNSKREIPCSVPITHGPKDYKLSSEAMHQATLHVLSECKERNLKVDSFSTDRQWINLMTRDGKGNPTTIYQLQKDLWKEVKKISKQELYKVLASLNKHTAISCKQHQDNPKCLVVESGARAFSSATTNMKVFKAKKSGKIPEDRDEEDQSLVEHHNSDWLFRELLRKVEEDDESDLAHAIGIVENVMQYLRDQGNGSQESHFENVDGSSRASYENNETEDLLTFDEDTISTILRHFDENDRLRSKWSNRDSSYLKGPIHNEIQDFTLTHLS